VNLLGLGYVISWGLCYYPQIRLNYTTKSTSGLSMDFVLLNVTGYIGYMIYNIMLVMSEKVRESYMQSTGVHGISARATDVFFTVHGTILTAIVLGQCIYYSNDLKWYSNWTKHGRMICAGLWFALIFASFNLLNNYTSNSLLLFLQVFGNVKLIVTIVKYPPQIYYNYKRQSTAGWSITYSWLDSLGGIFSLLQMIALYIQMQDWTIFSGNFPKLGLGVLALLCNGILLFQHYALYSGKYELPTHKSGHL